jgi:hypothetical protein
MKRWGCLTLIVIGVGLFAVFVLSRRNAKERFEEAVQELRAAGEPTDPAEFAPPRVPDSQNAEPLLRRIVEAKLELDLKHDELFNLMSVEENEPELEAYVRAAAPLYRDIESALRRRSFWVDVDWSQGYRMSHDWMWRLVAVDELLRARARLDMRSPATLPRCAETIAQMLDLAKLPNAYPAHLFRANFEAGAIRVLRDLLEMPGFDAARFRAILDERLAADESHRPELTLRRERVLAIHFFQNPDDELMDAWTSLGRDWESWTDDISRRLLWKPFLYRDANRYLAIMEEGLGICADPTPAAVESSARLMHRTQQLPAYYLMSRSGGIRVFLNLWMAREATARLRLARTALALLVYRREHGGYPPELDEVEASTDPFTGRSFSYERTDGEVRIASAAPDVVPVMDERLRSWFAASIDFEDRSWTLPN